MTGGRIFLVEGSGNGYLRTRVSEDGLRLGAFGRLVEQPAGDLRWESGEARAERVIAQE
jgi:hypothetical protein